MIDDMGVFRTTLGVSAMASPGYRRDLPDATVNTRSLYNWIPRPVLVELGVSPVRVDRFETPDGRELEREIGFAVVHAGGRSVATVTVFAEVDDITCLGAHGLEGLNLRVDPRRNELVPAGPVPVALTDQGGAIS
jgi:predicted aspartyl protease